MNDLVTELMHPELRKRLIRDLRRVGIEHKVAETIVKHAETKRILETRWPLMSD